jgi:hypothetical protein
MVPISKQWCDRFDPAHDVVCTVEVSEVDALVGAAFCAGTHIGFRCLAGVVAAALLKMMVQGNPDRAAGPAGRAAQRLARFQQQDARSRILRSDGGAHAGHATAHHHDIELLLLFFFADRAHACVLRPRLG